MDAMRTGGVRRLIAVTSSAVDPDAHPEGGLVGRLVIGPLIGRLGRTMYGDMRRMEGLLQDSDLDWTIVRPPALFDKADVGPMEVSTDPLGARFAARQDLAALMLQEVTETEHVRRILYLASLEGEPNLLRTIWEDGLGRKKAPAPVVP